MDATADVIVVGSGPAGAAAALMAASLQLDVLVFEPGQVGGRLWAITDMKNLPGHSDGPSLARTIESQLAAAKIRLAPSEVTNLDLTSETAAVLAGHTVFRCSHIVCATGLRPRAPDEVDWLEYDRAVPPTPLWGDAPPTGKSLVVIGGDRPLGTFLRSSIRGAAPIVVLYRPEERYKLQELATGPWNLECHEVETVSVFAGADGIIVSAANGDDMKIWRDCLPRLNIGSIPNTALISPHVELNTTGYPKRSRLAGLSIVGDAAHERFQRVSVAMGEGATAVLEWYYSREQLL